MTKKCDGIVRCSCYILELNHGINSKWQFLSCAAIALHSVSDTITQFTCAWWHRLIKGKGYPMTSLYRYRGDVEVCSQLLCNLGARRGWVVNPTLWPPYSRKRPGSLCTGGSVGLGAGLDRDRKSHLDQNSTPGLSSL